MTRPSEFTRQALIEAATTVFAEKGFEGGSVRLITQKAEANQAAINYHFGGKEGLYREVLRGALHAFDEFSLIDESRLPEMDRDEALRLFLRQQLVPLVKRDQLSRAMRLFNWEILQRTEVFQGLLSTERIPTLTAAEGILRKFLPDTASPEERTVALIWLINQAYIFVRHYEHLSKPPANLKLDEGFMERLIDMLARLLTACLAGLPGAAQRKGPAQARPRIATL
jgi:AcrR family transcriptional regulator